MKTRYFEVIEAGTAVDFLQVDDSSVSEFLKTVEASCEVVEYTEPTEIIEKLSYWNNFYKAELYDKEEEGRSPVDSGQLMIIDPCYLIDGWKGEQSYEAVCNVTQSKSAGQVINGLGFAFDTNGDGQYAIDVKRDDNGRILSVEIVLY